MLPRLIDLPDIKLEHSFFGVLAAEYLPLQERLPDARIAGDQSECPVRARAVRGIFKSTFGRLQPLAQLRICCQVVSGEVVVRRRTGRDDGRQHRLLDGAQTTGVDSRHVSSRECDRVGLGPNPHQPREKKHSDRNKGSDAS